VRGDYVAARKKAYEVLDAEAQRRGLPPGSVTEEQVATVPSQPRKSATAGERAMRRRLGLLQQAGLQPRVDIG
jgi:hypothetical protein